MNEIKGVEIFSAGEWNGDEYTIEDLHGMVQAFNENKVGVRPYLKLGHDEKQKLIQSDGMPAAGWVETIYVVGEKLMADFTDIPDKIYKLIKSKAYRKVSSEIFWNLKIGEKTYKRMLAAVALLGANTPGVLNLNDILAVYKKYEGDYEKLSIDNVAEFKLDDESTNEKGVSMTKTENEVKLEFTLSQKETELKAKEDALALAEAAKKTADEEIESLRKFKADAVAREAVLASEAATAKIEKFVTELKAEKLCTPGMEPLMTQLLGDEKKEYSIKVQDKDEKATKAEVMKELLKLFKAAKDVNFDEGSSEGDKKTFANDDEEIDKKAKKFMQEKNCTYAQALKEVLKEKKK